MKIEPVNTDHAIILAEFRLQFDQPLSRKTHESIRFNHHHWKDDLPAYREGQVYSLNLNRNNATPDVKPQPSYEFAYLKPDGSHSWSMVIDEREVVVQCTRYTRWEKVYKQASDLLTKALAVIAGEQELGIPVVSLKMIDHFLGFKDDTAYDIYDIFQRGSLIPEKMEDVGEVWHSHTGWFSRSQDYDVLNLCNIDAVRRGEDVNLQKNADFGTTITHIQNSNFRQPLSVKDPKQLEYFFEEMHITNKEILNELLQDSLLEQIGLKNVS